MAEDGLCKHADGEEKVVVDEQRLRLPLILFFVAVVFLAASQDFGLEIVAVGGLFESRIKNVQAELVGNHVALDRKPNEMRQVHGSILESKWSA